MRTHIIIDCILIGGFATYAFIPFTGKRIRATWARLVFVISAIIGVAQGIAGLAWDMDWFSLSSDSTHLFETVQHAVGGMLLGFIFSLILSGQLCGTKQPRYGI